MIIKCIFFIFHFLEYCRLKITPTSLMLSKSSINLEFPKTCNRIVTINQKQEYCLENTGMMKKWKVKTPDIKVEMFVNGLKVDLPDLDGIHFDCEKIREYCREVIPMTTEENRLCVIESTIYAAQLLAMEHYAYFPFKYFKNFIFSGGLMISFKPIDKTPESFELEEEFILTTKRLTDRLKKETLDEIDKNNFDSSTTVSASS